MGPHNAWQRYFDGHAPVYMEQPYTKGTAAEVDFLLDVLELPPGRRILDLACGAGRHPVELVRRGYAVTGVDLSAGMLAEARRAARAAGVAVEWVQADAARYTTSAPFDAAVCLCEGAFAVYTDDPCAHDLAVLRALHAALRPGARLALNAPNGFAMIRQYSQADVDAGRFDPLTMIEVFAADWETPAGTRESVQLRERGYLPTELTELLTGVGFVVDHIWGGSPGRLARRPVDLDEVMILAVARKAGPAMD